MGIINLEDIQPGMMLEKDVMDRSGRILLGAGAAISEKHLRIFRMWGVTEADIRNVRKEEVSARAAARLDPVVLEKAYKRLLEMFQHADRNHPFNSEFFQLLTFRMVKRSGRGGP